MHDYERAKMKASREYAEELINPEEVANPEFSDSIDFYAMWMVQSGVAIIVKHLMKTLRKLPRNMVAKM